MAHCLLSYPIQQRSESNLCSSLTWPSLCKGLLYVVFHGNTFSKNAPMTTVVMANGDETKSFASHSKHLSDLVSTAIRVSSLIAFVFVRDRKSLLSRHSLPDLWADVFTGIPLSGHFAHANHAWGQGKFRFSCSADHKQGWQAYAVEVQSTESDDHTHEQ